MYDALSWTVTLNWELDVISSAHHQDHLAVWVTEWATHLRVELASLALVGQFLHNSVLVRGRTTASNDAVLDDDALRQVGRALGWNEGLHGSTLTQLGMTGRWAKVATGVGTLSHHGSSSSVALVQARTAAAVGVHARVSLGAALARVDTRGGVLGRGSKKLRGRSMSGSGWGEAAWDAGQGKGVRRIGGSRRGARSLGVDGVAATAGHTELERAVGEDVASGRLLGTNTFHHSSKALLRSGVGHDAAWLVETGGREDGGLVTHLLMR